MEVSVETLCKNFLEKHKVKRDGDYIVCKNFNEADTVNLICEIFKILEKK